MPKVERDGVTYSGVLYQSASGGITPEILTHAIKNVWGPCYPTRSAEQVVGSLCDAYGYHWDKEVLDACHEGGVLRGNHGRAERHGPLAGGRH
jgi:hypothetical protein